MFLLLIKIKALPFLISHHGHLPPPFSWAEYDLMGSYRSRTTDHNLQPLTTRITLLSWILLILQNTSNVQRLLVVTEFQSSIFPLDSNVVQSLQQFYYHHPAIFLMIYCNFWTQYYSFLGQFLLFWFLNIYSWILILWYIVCASYPIASLQESKFWYEE